MVFAKGLFVISAMLTVISALFVAGTKNIMHACVYLLGTLIGVAGLYITLGADFIAAVQIMVYVGGVVILMLFAVMLTGGREFMQSAHGLLNRSAYMGSKKTYAYASGVALVLVASIWQLISNSGQSQNNELVQTYSSTVEKIGISLLTDHVLAFEFSSVLLLGALIGAAIIARPQTEQKQ